MSIEKFKDKHFYEVLPPHVEVYAEDVMEVPSRLGFRVDKVWQENNGVGLSCLEGHYLTPTVFGWCVEAHAFMMASPRDFREIEPPR